MDKIETDLKDLKKEDLKVILKSLDTDGSGCIEYSEFIAATMDRAAYTQETALWAAFRVFDLDNDGVITKDELKKVLQTDASVAAALKEVDTDGDGTISFEEFKAAMTAA